MPTYYVVSWNLRHLSSVSSKGEILNSRGARENQGRVCEGYPSISLLNSGSLDSNSLQNKGWPPACAERVSADRRCMSYVCHFRRNEGQNKNGMSDNRRHKELILLVLVIGTTLT